MTKIADYHDTFRCSVSSSSPFRIRLYSGPLPVVIASLADAPDTDIDPRIDSYLAAEVAAWQSDILRDSRAFRWVVQSSRDRYALTTFEYLDARPVTNHATQRRWFGTPTKRTILREEVEAMIGERP